MSVNCLITLWTINNQMAAGTDKSLPQQKSLISLHLFKISFKVTLPDLFRDLYLETQWPEQNFNRQQQEREDSSYNKSCGPRYILELRHYCQGLPSVYAVLPLICFFVPGISGSRFEGVGPLRSTQQLQLGYHNSLAWELPGQALVSTVADRCAPSALSLPWTQQTINLRD